LGPVPGTGLAFKLTSKVATNYYKLEATIHSGQFIQDTIEIKTGTEVANLYDYIARAGSVEIEEQAIKILSSL
jgi:hypothetical protein